jgi:hypothetical protein
VQYIGTAAAAAARISAVEVEGKIEEKSYSTFGCLRVRVAPRRQENRREKRARAILVVKINHSQSAGILRNPLWNSFP